MTIATKMPTASNAATSVASLSMTASTRNSMLNAAKAKNEASLLRGSKKLLPNLSESTSAAHLNETELAAGLVTQSRAPLKAAVTTDNTRTTTKPLISDSQQVTLSKRKLSKLRTPAGMTTLNESIKEEDSDEEIKSPDPTQPRVDDALQKSAAKTSNVSAEAASEKATNSGLKQQQQAANTNTNDQEAKKQPNLLKPIKKRAKSLNKKPVDQHHNAQSPQSQSSASHTPSYLTSSSASGASSSYHINSNYDDFANQAVHFAADIDENENDSNHFDLYRPETNIVYIKQKYKMYLDWLNENCLKSSVLQQQQQQQSQLNWYNYEKSVFENNDTINTKNYYKFLNAILNNSSSKGAASAKAVRAKLSQQTPYEKADPKTTTNPQSFFQQQKSKSSLSKSSSIKFSMDTRASPSPTKSELGQRAPAAQLTPIESANPPASHVASRKALIELKISTANKHLRSDAEASSEDMASTNTSKGVKFEPNHETLSSAKLGASKRNANAAAATTGPTTAGATISHFNSSVTSSKVSTSTSSQSETRLTATIKPILKSSHSNNSSTHSNDYQHSSKSSSDPFAIRHNSIGSNSTTSYKTPSHSYEKTSTTTISSLSSNKNGAATASGSRLTAGVGAHHGGHAFSTATLPLKLPPITTCSDVFYSVLYDMEKAE